MKYLVSMSVIFALFATFQSAMAEEQGTANNEGPHVLSVTACVPVKYRRDADGKAHLVYAFAVNYCLKRVNDGPGFFQYTFSFGDADEAPTAEMQHKHREKFIPVPDATRANVEAYCQHKLGIEAAKIELNAYQACL